MSALPNKGKKNTTAGFWIAIALLCLVLLASVMVNFGLLLVAGLKSSSFRYAGGGQDEYPQLVEQWSYGYGDVKVVRIPVQGALMRQAESGFFGTPVDRIQQIVRQIRAAANDEDVAAILLEVNSPGGAITPSDEIYNELLRFKASREDRIVTVLMRDLAASGAYYVSMGADWIMAEPTTVVGSIGVIMQTINWKELADSVGIRDVTIKSGTNKDMLNPFGQETDEQIALLQEIIDNMHGRFTDIVQEARGIDHESLLALADGRVFTADQAMEYQLIDEIGYWDDIVIRTAELLGEESIKVVRYQRPTDFFSLFSQVRFPFSPSSLLDLSIPRPMYLWRP